MAYRVIVKCGGGAFFVPNEAAENLKLCTAAQLRVLLLTLSRGFSEMTPEIAAAELGLTQDDAKDLLDYWVNRGILERDGVSCPAVQTAPAGEACAAASPAPAFAPAQPAPKPPEMKMTMKEVERLQKEDPGIAFVLHEAERILGTSFTSSDTATLVWLVSWAGITPEVLVMVIEYCSTLGKKNMRYIQKVALEWLDCEIDTVEKAEERIRALNEAKSWEGEIKSLLGIRDRNLVSKERELCESWRMLGLSPELIHAAYERTVEQTGKLSFPYLNKILISWKQKGIKTPEEAAIDTKAKPKADKPSFDIDELERRMMLEDSVI